jgi:Predicted thiol oxidoreductase
MIGLGLIENISETDILINADVNDINGDGISGKANIVWHNQIK